MVAQKEEKSQLIESVDSQVSFQPSDSLTEALFYSLHSGAFAVLFFLVALLWIFKGQLNRAANAYIKSQDELGQQAKATRAWLIQDARVSRDLLERLSRIETKVDYVGRWTRRNP